MSKRAPTAADSDLLYPIGRDYFGKKTSAKKDAKSSQTAAEPPPLRHVTYAAEKLGNGEAQKEMGRGLSKQTQAEIRELLKAGWPVMLHGYGSKMDVLENFTEDYLADMAVVTIHGFDARLALSRCLAAAVATVSRKKPKDFQHLSLDVLVGKLIDLRKTGKLAFVVHAIDGIALRNHQGALMKLAGNFPFIATVDHVRAPLLWNQEIVEKFVWREISTFVPYNREVLGACGTLLPAWSGLGATESGVKRQSLQVVLVSLTPNHRQLVELLAKLQSADEKGGVKKSVLLERSRKSMIASDQNKLNSLLTELIDHGIVKPKKEGESGVELLFIPGTNTEILRYSKGDFSLDDEPVMAEEAAPAPSARGG